jgi:hypothetical protein
MDKIKNLNKNVGSWKKINKKFVEKFLNFAEQIKGCHKYKYPTKFVKFGMGCGWGKSHSKFDFRQSTNFLNPCPPPLKYE